MAHTVLMVAAIVCFMAAAVLAALALHAYVTLDVHGVLDDLSGRARQRGIERDVAHDYARRTQPGGWFEGVRSAALDGAEAPGGDGSSPSLTSEDDIATTVGSGDEKTSPSPDYYKKRDECYKSRGSFEPFDYARGSVGRSTDAFDPPTVVGDGGADATGFRVTRSIVITSADEEIQVGWE